MGWVFLLRGSEYEEGFLPADVEVEWDRPSDELQLYVHDGYLTAFFFAAGRIQQYAVVPEGMALPDGIYALLDSPGEQGYRKESGIGHAGSRLIRPDSYTGVESGEANVALTAWRKVMES